ncbi:TIGR04282 family arsenosugar biosynthesis glycosyltransferase [Trichothermofontia sp.]
MKQTLIIFMRYPQPGTTKTRLIPALGAAGAAQLYRHLAERTLAQAVALQAQQVMDIEIWFAGGSVAQMQAWLGDHQVYRSQPAGDLGERMAAAFAAVLAAGIVRAALPPENRAVLIGTDCPGLNVDHLTAAFAALATHDVVLGPAQDGGYYLIGLQRPIVDLFVNMPWSTAIVAQRTLSIAAQLGLSVHCLPRLTDIDQPGDLTHAAIAPLVAGIKTGNACRDVE